MATTYSFVQRTLLLVKSFVLVPCFVTGCLVALNAATASAQSSFHIQSGGLFAGGFQLGIQTAPSFRQGPIYGYSPFGHPNFDIRYGIPQPHYQYRYAYPYEQFQYRGDVFDYRFDYYNRLRDPYLYGLQRDLIYGYPQYRYRFADPFGPPLDPVFGYRSARPPVAQIEPFSAQDFAPFPPNRSNPQLPAESIPEAIRAAATRLSASLSRRQDDGEIWLNYLAPGRIIQAVDQGRSADAVQDLLRNYDGVVANPELRAIIALDGFARTRQLLRQWIDSQAAAPSEPIQEFEADNFLPQDDPNGAEDMNVPDDLNGQPEDVNVPAAPVATPRRISV
jgi:hypothetical protein